MKKFLILGNLNAITYKEVFPLIKDNKLWTGYKCFGGGMNMIQPEETFDESKTKSFTINDKGEIIKNIMGVIWFTNLDHKKRHEPLDLYKKYNPEEYPKYDNYDAINVDKVKDIPVDYHGVIGVPITFIDKYCPEQFEVIGITENADYLKPLYVEGCEKYDRPYLSGKRIYSRLLIKHHSEEPDIINGGVFNNPYVNGKKKYQRLLIKRR